MNNILMTNDPVTAKPAQTSSHSNTSEEGVHTKYLDKDYIVRAREAEVKHHLHSIGQLQKKMEKLANELAWELEQHHSKIHELYQLETPLQTHEKTTTVNIQPSKKSTITQKKSQTFDLPLIGKSFCETFA
ncbi:MAG: hypothetical protein NPIRA05_01210 [Nitrospirales bacterium]|nr:MAG: hypothetical protein NPIRA05_01210 [Nitrospirales bacterium]